ncbi:MAG: hypothetical protein IJZ15_02705 [Oscillospiraceae bacterium]|nr:hypothetical protein [Oscillospiraceae bacterium]
MEEKELQDTVPEQDVTPCEPRPVWQRVLAWIGVGIVVLGVILYYYHIASGGR